MELPYLIYSAGGARIFGSPSPTFAGSVRASIGAIRDVDVHQLISTVGHDEMIPLGLAHLAGVCADAGMRLHHFAIPDRGVPQSPDDFSDFVAAKAGDFRLGGSLCVHCKAGIGRTGMVIAAILGHLGFDLREAYDLISARRGCRVPDTPAQYEWMQENWHRFASNLSSTTDARPPPQHTE